MAIRGTWERPIDALVAQECRLDLRNRVEAYDDLVDAINNIDLWPMWEELGGEEILPWGNFQHLYRDELLRRFGSDGRSDSPILET